MPSWLSLGFQDSSSVTMLEITKLHDHILTIMTMIIVLVLYVLIYLMLDKTYYKHLSEGTLIETVWSIVPALLLVVLVIPSMKVLYLMEDNLNPSLSVKVIAYQWYWAFSFYLPYYPEDSFYFGCDHTWYDTAITDDFPRLLSGETDLILPLGETSRLLVTSGDVIHAFSIPSMGLKIDALPGRVNQIFVSPSRLGVYYGQCSEICGTYHSFMPVSVKVVPLFYYLGLCQCLSFDNFIENAHIFF